MRRLVGSALLGLDDPVLESDADMPSPLAPTTDVGLRGSRST